MAGPDELFATSTVQNARKPVGPNATMKADKRSLSQSVILLVSLVVGALCALLLSTPLLWFTSEEMLYAQAGEPELATQPAPDVVAQNSSIWYTPRTLHFGEVGVNILSARQTVTITNVGATVITFGGGTAPMPFSASHDCAGGLAPGDSCHYFYRFRPTEAGFFSATSGPGSNAGPVVVTLEGAGVEPVFTYSPRAIDFGSVLSGTMSPPQTVTVKNSGLATISFSGGDAAAPYSSTNNCAPVLEPGQSCDFVYRFAPTGAGTFTTITGPISDAGARVEIQMTGQGVSGSLPENSFVASPLEIDFGPVGVEQTSPPHLVTLRNTSSNAVNMSNFAGSGLDAPFSVNADCAGNVPSGDSCTYSFRFSPTSTGVVSDTFNGTTSLGPYMVILRGEGTGAKKFITPLSLDFGPVPLNGASPPQQVRIQNPGATPLGEFAGGGVSPPFSVSQTCTGGVAPGGSCTYTFRFSPTEAGIFTESSDTASNAGPIAIQLSGGIAPPALEASFTPKTLKGDGTSTLELAITNPNPNLALTGVSVRNDLPAGLLIESAESATTSDECGVPMFAPKKGETSLTFSDGTIEGGKTCMVQVKIIATAAGDYANKTNRVEADNPAGKGNSTTATLMVSHERYLPKVHK